ncbi:hypothetical protein, partial [Mesorhizobium sp. LNHC229A00]|uniref:hypothetical protein n=1 Tax=Mesorhizobium sp. LNHC229A00 TaxID=1287240 RepID=UPI000518029C
PGLYGSYAVASWLKDLSSAVWTVELPRDAATASYDPEENPQGAIRTGCAATQYLHKHIFSTVKGFSGGDGTYDLSRSLAADPSHTACAAAAFKIQKLK